MIDPRVLFVLISPVIWNSWISKILVNQISRRDIELNCTSVFVI